MADLMAARRQTWRPAGTLLVAAVLLWAVLAGVGRLLAHQLASSALVRWDGSLDRTLAAHRNPTLNQLSQLATFGAETITVIAVGLLAFALLRWRLGRWRESIFLAACVVGEVTVFLGTTLVVDRHRPDVPRLDAAPPTSSFPSGHTAASTALYGALAVIAWRVGRAGWLKALAAVVAVGMPVAVAMSRLYRGMHYPSDVLAGALLAVCWVAVCRVVLLSERGRTR